MVWIYYSFPTSNVPMLSFRCHQMDQKPDPSFRQYFNWPTLKDPKGTLKTRTVLKEQTSSLPADSSRKVCRPIKKKRKTASKTSKTSKVRDEDFLQLQAFIMEIFGPEEPTRIRNPKSHDQVETVVHIDYLIISHITFF